MKPVRLAIIVLVLIITAGVVAWRSQWYFLHNKTTFLLNQRRFEEAVQLIDKLQRRNPTHPRTRFLKIKALSITGDFHDAAQLAQKGGRIADPEMLYWVALAQFQTGNVEDAAASARQFLKTGDKLPAGSQKIVNSLAGSSDIVDPPDQESLEFRLLFPVEKGVYLGLAGLQQWQMGRLDIAAQLIRDAFRMDNRNPDFLHDGAKVLGLVGDVQNARMLWDYANVGTIEPLYQELQSLLQDFQPVSLTLNSEDMARGGAKNRYSSCSCLGSR